MKLSLGQAAKECGKSKATISKAIKSGKLSVMGQTSAGYEIDPAELFRVFPKTDITNDQRVTVNDQKSPKSTDISTSLAIELGQARANNAALEQQIALLRETVERERANTDEWRKQAQTLALTDQREKRGGLFRMFKKAE